MGATRELGDVRSVDRLIAPKHNGLAVMNHEEIGLLVDVYELTMAQSYLQQGMHDSATFSLFIRNYPPDRGYLVSAGLEGVLTYLENLCFVEESIDYLRSLEMFADEFLDYLKSFKFTGDVWAIPEGRLFFAEEPVVEVTAPIIESQMVETFIMNQVNLQCLIATKASRCVWAAEGRPIVDFSLRRTHGIDAGMKVARATHIVGCQGTSNVLAGKVYGIPLSGTMAHSFISTHRHEVDAFRAFARSFPDRSIFLIDTYDTVAGARKAALVAKEMEAAGRRLVGVRLDSGDIAVLSRQVRQVLNEAGLEYVRIIATGGLDEFDIDDLVKGGAPIDGFGVGTKMGVSADAPWSDMAYKVVRYGERPLLKLSKDKVSLPGEKQVFRFQDDDGMFSEDVISLKDEELPHGDPLLEEVMVGGKRTNASPSLGQVQARFVQDSERLGNAHKALKDPLHYKVTVSSGLQELYNVVESELMAEEVGQETISAVDVGPGESLQ